MSQFRDFEHHFQVSVEIIFPIFGWCSIRTFTNPCWSVLKCQVFVPSLLSLSLSLGRWLETPRQLDSCRMSKLLRVKPFESDERGGGRAFFCTWEDGEEERYTSRNLWSYAKNGPFLVQWNKLWVFAYSGKPDIWHFFCRGRKSKENEDDVSMIHVCFSYCKMFQLGVSYNGRFPKTMGFNRKMVDNLDDFRGTPWVQFEHIYISSPESIQMPGCWFQVCFWFDMTSFWDVHSPKLLTLVYLRDRFLKPSIHKSSLGSVSHFCRWESGAVVGDLSGRYQF